MVDRGYPQARPAPPAPAGARSFESYEWYEARRPTLAAGTAFVEVARFSGRPDRIEIQSGSSDVEVRLSRRGEAPGDPVRIVSIGAVDFGAGADLVEARDVNGVGGQSVLIMGFYGTAGVRGTQAALRRALPTPA